MPPGGKLPAGEIDILTRWVKEGVPWTHAAGCRVRCPGSDRHGSRRRPGRSPPRGEQWSHQPGRAPAGSGGEGPRLGPQPDRRVPPGPARGRAACTRRPRPIA